MNKFMQKAIEEAKKSGADIPVGAVIVKDGKILACCHNEREKNSDISAHAEILCLKTAEKIFSNWRLDGCEMYVTLEPCPMCAWAILQSRVGSVFFGSFDNISGAFGSACDLRKISTSKIKVYSGIEEQACNDLINNFWKEKR